jgi:hypothetical protein
VNKTDKLLAFARKHHPKGARFTDLQRFIVELNGLNYDQKEPIMRWDDNLRQRVKVGMRRQWRGYWCDRFFDTLNYKGSRQGILSRYFRKLPDGRYVVKS